MVVTRVYDPLLRSRVVCFYDCGRSGHELYSPGTFELPVFLRFFKDISVVITRTRFVDVQWVVSSIPCESVPTVRRLAFPFRYQDVNPRRIRIWTR